MLSKLREICNEAVSCTRTMTVVIQLVCETGSRKMCQSMELASTFRCCKCEDY